MEATPSPPPPFPPEKSMGQRYKLSWRLLMVSNLALGAYMFARAKMKDMEAHGRIGTEIPSTSVASPASLHPEEPVIPPTVIEPRKVLEPLPEDQQRELFKWILEEKRKTKPKDPKERKRVDEEKAILKRFIRDESIPTL